MQPPIRRIGLQLGRRQLQPTHQENKGHGTIQNTILGLDDSPMGSNTYSRHRNQFLSLLVTSTERAHRENDTQ